MTNSKGRGFLTFDDLKASLAAAQRQRIDTAKLIHQAPTPEIQRNREEASS
jgi:hypothetical protein